MHQKLFQNKFWKNLVAVKTNPHPEVLKAILDSGINNFDVASIKEIQDIKKLNSKVKCSYMHTIKSRESIREAYFKFNIKTFSLDTKEELIKIIDSTNHAKDLELFVRVAVSNEHVKIDLSKKFGALNSRGSSWFIKVDKTTCKKIGLSFHVGSQCMHPISYAKGIAEIGNIIKKTKIVPDYINVGGFPTIYPDLVPQSLDNYFEEIKKGIRKLKT